MIIIRSQTCDRVLRPLPQDDSRRFLRRFNTTNPPRRPSPSVHWINECGSLCPKERHGFPAIDKQSNPEPVGDNRMRNVQGQVRRDFSRIERRTYGSAALPNSAKHTATETSQNKQKSLALGARCARDCRTGTAARQGGSRRSLKMDRAKQAGRPPKAQVSLP